jgi:predicted nucleic-acid-binding protein
METSNTIVEIQEAQVIVEHRENILTLINFYLKEKSTITYERIIASFRLFTDLVTNFCKLETHVWTSSVEQSFLNNLSDANRFMASLVDYSVAPHTKSN